MNRNMKKLNVIYSLSTLPFFAKNPDESEFRTDRFELYTAAISSLTRRKDGNYTVMHCDTRGAEYLSKIGLCKLWNNMKITIPDDLEGINPKMFWAAGKLFALKMVSCPVLMLDTDFIAWHLPPPEQLSTGITAAHREPLLPGTYPNIRNFKMNNYSFNPDFNYTVEPLNTAFLYIGDGAFKKHYVNEAINFMKSAVPCDDYLTYMVYAEQRLLAILADYRKIPIKTVLEFDRLNLPQKSFTHTWGAKQVMRNNPAELERFCEKCRRRIRDDFPEYEYVIELIESAFKN